MLGDLQYYPDRIEFLRHLTKGGTVAEIGVYCGDYASLILEIARPKLLYLIDLWPDSDVSNGPTVINGLKCKEIVQDRFASEISKGQVRLIHSDSVEAAKFFRPHIFDWVYLDSSHTYRQTLRELNAYKSLIKPGGMFCGHDYNHIPPNNDFCCVERATTDFCRQNGFLLSALTLEESYPRSFGIRF